MNGIQAANWSSKGGAVRYDDKYKIIFWSRTTGLMLYKAFTTPEGEPMFLPIDASEMDELLRCEGWVPVEEEYYMTLWERVLAAVDRRFGTSFRPE
jgi:hypothetical protein